MADEFKLDIFKRDNLSKSSLKQLRRDGNIPGIFYSYNSKESIPFYMGNKTLSEAKKSGARIFNIAVGSKKQTVIFKSVQYHPVTEEILHIDLYGVKMDEKIQIKVPLELLGDPIGVTQEGGNLMQSILEIDVVCLPTNIPDKIELDISELHIGESIHAGAVQLPENIDLGLAEDTVVAAVTHAMKDSDLETAVSEDEDITFDDSDDGGAKTDEGTQDSGQSNSDSE